MSTLLYVIASPRGDRSKSRALAEAFIDQWTQANPDGTVDRLDVFETDLPAFDGPAMEAKYTILHGDDPTGEQARAWSRVEEVIDRFTSADKVVFAVPMWNFGIPYRLKQLFDVIVQPGYTFKYSPDEGYTGLVTGKPAFVACARGGDYDEKSSASVDHQLSYMELILGFMGFTDIRSLVVQPTLMGGPEEAGQALTRQLTRAREMAGSF
ncbi:MAG: FMN-dependent NADH-azoreductase [Planctomycetota bacterium]